MKRLLTILMVFAGSICMAQVNLVMNPSLEQYSVCPDNYDEVKYADYWMGLDTVWSPPDLAHAPPGVPEFCHVCATDATASVPWNARFYQYPRTGQGLAQVQMLYEAAWPANPFKRDYLQGHLSSVLVAGHQYCVSFYVVSEESSKYAIQNIGAYLDDGTIDTTHNPGHPQTHCIPQVTATRIINDTLHWTKIQGSFIANGRESLITIGNFSDNGHTTFIAVRDTVGCYIGGCLALYLVDDVSVMAIDATISAGPDHVITGPDSVTIGDTLDSYLPTYWYANGRLVDSNTAWLRVKPDTTTMYVVELSRCGGDNITDTVWVYVGALGAASPRPTPIERVVLLPNPAQGIFTVVGAAGGELFIYDMVGREVLHTSIATAQETIDVSGVAPGLYVAQVVLPDGVRKCVRLAVQ